MDTTSLPSITESISAIAALGTAAFGLVDTTKAFWGGISNAGFGRLQAALARFNPALDSLGNAPWQTLRANWLNGVSKADQKAAAKSLIHLALSAENAKALADAVGVDAVALKTAAGKVNKGTKLDPGDIDILGRFDALVSAVLDAGYERADQAYRNAAKLLAALVAIGLAVVAGGIVRRAGFDGYPGSPDMWVAIIIGAISTPLAPIAKDLSTSLAAAVKAVSVKR